MTSGDLPKLTAGERRELDGTRDTRREPRYAARFAGALIVDRRPLAIEIVDISRVGACVRGADLPQRGEEVVLTSQGLEVVGTIVWSDGTVCGVNFHRTIAPLEVVNSNLHLPNLNTLTKAIAMRG